MQSFPLPLMSHPHSWALWGSVWQCKPDPGSKVSAGMNNSACSGWCAPANGRYTLEQTAGLPLMSLSRLSQIVLVLNHPFPPAQSPQAHCLEAANGLNPVTAQRHLLIKSRTQLHQHKPVFNVLLKGIGSCSCHTKVVLYLYMLSAGVLTQPGEVGKSSHQPSICCSSFSNPAR